MDKLQELSNLIQHEQVCLYTWVKGEDMSIMPDNWSIEQQETYLEDLYGQFYAIWCSMNIED